MTRVTLDLDRLVDDGRLSRDEADRLAEMADDAPRGRILANVLFIFGALATVAGVLAFQPPLDVGLGMAVGSTALGALLVFRARDEWGLLGHALTLMGALGVAGWIVIRFNELGGDWSLYAWPCVSALFITGAIGLRNAVLAAFAPIALGQALGSSTGYWSATYTLFVRESAITFLVFALIAAALFWARPLLSESYRLVSTVAARVSFFLANFALWVGSLFGDYPGELWATRDGSWSASSEWRETALHIPDTMFSIIWAAFLVLALIVGIRSGRRFVANTSIVFLAIHLYTQFFELLGFHPLAMVVGGVILIVGGVGVARFDRWLRNRGAT